MTEIHPGTVGLQPGIRQGCSREEYDAIPAVRQSHLKHFRRSAAHARAAMLAPAESTDEQELGTAIHCAVLEPKQFASFYVARPDYATGLCDDAGKPYANPKATNKYKAKMADFENANLGKILIDADEMAVCAAIVDAIAANETAANLLSTPGRQELAAVWVDPETKLCCKALIDRITSHAAQTVVVDLKSTKDASPGAFAFDCDKFGYHVQAAFYLDGLNVLGPASRLFVLIAVEKEPPFGVAVYELDDESIELGRREYRRYLAEYLQCVESGHWPGYPDQIQELSLPKRAFTRGEFDAE